MIYSVDILDIIHIIALLQNLLNCFIAYTIFTEILIID